MSNLKQYNVVFADPFTDECFTIEIIAKTRKQAHFLALKSRPLLEVCDFLGVFTSDELEEILSRSRKNEYY